MPAVGHCQSTADSCGEPCLLDVIRKPYCNFEEQRYNDRLSVCNGSLGLPGMFVQRPLVAACLAGGPCLVGVQNPFLCQHLD